MKLLSYVHGVGVRCLVGDGLAHEVVDHFPAALSTAFGVVGSRDHRAVVGAEVKLEVLGHRRPVLRRCDDANKRHLQGVGMMLNGGHDV